MSQGKRHVRKDLGPALARGGRDATSYTVEERLGFLETTFAHLVEEFEHQGDVVCQLGLKVRADKVVMEQLRAALRAARGAD